MLPHFCAWTLQIFSILRDSVNQISRREKLLIGLTTFERNVDAYIVIME